MLCQGSYIDLLADIYVLIISSVDATMVETWMHVYSSCIFNSLFPVG